MTREKIAETLATNFKEINEIDLIDTPIKNKSSNWSKSICCEKGKELKTLVNVFGLTQDAVLENLFDAATSGDGNEKSRILTLHSSSLLAFLHFSCIRTKPINILGTEYVDVMFEVKNNVIDNHGNPSNMDILLLDKSRRKLLFLESKFTEYISGGRAYFSNPKRYIEFYNTLCQDKNRFDFKASEIEVQHRPNKEKPDGYVSKEYCLHNDKRPASYLNGIKQAFSHLIGIATGPSAQTNANKDYTKQTLENAKEITFASIVFNCNQEKYKAYSKLYESTFCKDNAEAIKNAIKTVIPTSKTLDKLIIHNSLLTYQNVFNGYELPKSIRSFYTLQSDNPASI